VANLAESLDGSIWEPTAESLRMELKKLDSEVLRLEKGYLRRAETIERYQTPVPDGYASWSDLILEPILEECENPAPAQRQMILKLLSDMRTRRDQLRSHVASRAGDPKKSDRYQNRREWRDWSQNKKLDRKVGSSRMLARSIILSGAPFAYTLHMVALRSMMKSGHQLTGSEADALKKSVEREYRKQRGHIPPRVPRGWWHAKQGFKPTPGGLMPLDLPWRPEPYELPIR